MDFPRRTRVTIHFLPPLFPKTGETQLALTDRLMFELASALPEDKRGVYAERPDGFKEKAFRLSVDSANLIMTKDHPFFKQTIIPSP